jgi:hypothetical protein
LALVGHPSALLTDKECDEARAWWNKERVQGKCQSSAELFVQRIRHKPELLAMFINRYGHIALLGKVIDGARVMLIAYRTQAAGSNP